MKYLFALSALALAAPISAQSFIGGATAVDGDSLRVGEQRVRLHGIDAVELKQTCEKDGRQWNCGREAKDTLNALIAGKVVQCTQVDTDIYGRAVAVCMADRWDLSRMMVDAGYAIALPEFTQEYVGDEARAKSRSAGIWASEFQLPASYRDANPRDFATSKPRNKVSSGPFYRNCTEARMAGVAPIYRGQPGYRPEMDGDNDGIACEPYRGRR